VKQRKPQRQNASAPNWCQEQLLKLSLAVESDVHRAKESWRSIRRRRINEDRTGELDHSRRVNLACMAQG
jgi:hypothetical protein